jgi:hypothetical protein
MKLAFLIFSLICPGICFGAEAKSELHAAPRNTAPEQSRVIYVTDKLATTNFTPQKARLPDMIHRGIMALCETNSPEAAWHSLFSSQDIIGIKVYSAPGPVGGTRPMVVAALVESLLSAGFQASQIVIWDKRRPHLEDAGFIALGRRLGSRVTSSEEAGYDPTVFYESSVLGRLIWGDSEFSRHHEDYRSPREDEEPPTKPVILQQSPHNYGRKSFVSNLLTRQITKIINVTPLLNHNTAGVAGNLFSLASGSVDNILRFEQNQTLEATALPEIYALPEISEKVALSLVDALICQYEGEVQPRLNYATALNQLRFSKDPVALDVLSVFELDRQRRIAKREVKKPYLEPYINAALMDLGNSELRLIHIEEAP